MLRSFLFSVPCTKFILIEDSLQDDGKQIFNALIKNHLNKNQYRLHYCVHQESYTRAKNKYKGETNIVLHDFSSDVCGWEKTTKKETGTNFKNLTSKINNGEVVVFDSLANVVHQNGLAETYSTISQLKNKSGVQQIVALLHTDLLEENLNVAQIFEHLCTLGLSLRPKFQSGNNRVQYIYKKSGGKIIKQIEEYKFEGDNIVSKKIERLDPKILLESSILPEVDPETLSTFKIGLTDREKESRSELVLPYLPKSETKEKEEGQIFYKFDDVDDWDEEDPDDDLDI